MRESMAESNEPQKPPGGTAPIIPTHREQFRSPPGLAFRQLLRRNLLLFIATLIFIGTGILIFVQIDRVYYAREKAEVINNMIKNQRLLAGSPVLQELNDETEKYIAYLQEAESLEQQTLSDERRAARKEQLEQKRLRIVEDIEGKARQVLKEEPVVFRVSFIDKHNRHVVNLREPERKIPQNDWQNSLFSKDYEQQWANMKVVPRDDNGEIINEVYATLEISLTTPRGVPEIISVTKKWRTRSAVILLLLLLFYALALWGLLLPVRNVIMALDKGAAVGSPLIKRPRTVLEKYYNNLARDATLSIFSTSLRDFISAHQLIDQQPLMEYAPTVVRELFPVSGAEIWNFRREDASESWTLENVFSGGAEYHRAFEAVIEQRIAKNPPQQQPEEWEIQLLDYYDETDELYFWLPEIILSSENHLAILVLHLRGLRHGTAHWWQRLTKSIGREIRYASRSVSEQRRLIMQEKSKANISLSRNIGHDLTNIIATSKLELMSVRTLLEMPREEVYNSPVHKEIFTESLQALLNNTRFLQETVNLYRSFTYLSRPKFEVTDVNELVEDVCELFQLSLSRTFRIVQVLEPELPPVDLEPRLLRLALFNLLNNAADSIKRAYSADNPSGEIRIVTTLPADGNGVQISVEDTGGGIRARDGRLLEQHEIEDIFQLGYSTKEKDSGEGLGLNWVQQIVHDFHGGMLQARNLPGGGAAFVIVLGVQTGKIPAPVVEKTSPSADDIVRKS